MNLLSCAVLWGAVCLTSDSAMKEVHLLSDTDIADRIVHWSGYEDIGRRDYLRLIEQCNYNTNRLCCIARQVYENSHKQQVRSQALAIFWMFGSACDIPFLETCVVDPACGEYAIRILRKVEGLCSNSVDQVCRFHSLRNAKECRRLENDKVTAFRSLAEEIRQAKPDSGLKAYFVEVAPYCVSNNMISAQSVDEILLSFDPLYKNSLRRQEILKMKDRVVQRENEAQR